jgi:hypothetical protein
VREYIAGLESSKFENRKTKVGETGGLRESPGSTPREDNEQHIIRGGESREKLVTAVWPPTSILQGPAAKGVCGGPWSG